MLTPSMVYILDIFLLKNMCAWCKKSRVRTHPRTFGRNRIGFFYDFWGSITFFRAELPTWLRCATHRLQF